MNDLTAFLRIPLYLIARIDDVEAFTGLSPAQQQKLPESYTPEELRQIVAAMRFAVSNPNFDLKPFAPRPGFSNVRLHAFLVKVLASIPDSLIGDA